MQALLGKWAAVLTAAGALVVAAYFYGLNEGEQRATDRCEARRTESLEILAEITGGLQASLSEADKLLSSRSRATDDVFDEIKEQLDGVASDHIRDHCRLTERELRDVWNKANSGAAEDPGADG